MVKAILDTLVTDINNIMRGQTQASYTLLDNSEAAQFCQAMRKFDYVHGYRHKSVLELELKGNNYISGIMDMLWTGISNEGQDSLFSQYAYQRLSENYRRIYTESEMSDNYRKAQLLADAVSGMTDSYLIYLHDELKNLHG